MQKQLPPSEPIPPGFGPATPPWVWKVTYGVLGMLISAMIISGAVLFRLYITEQLDKNRQCWEPPQKVERWAYPTLVPVGGGVPIVCAERAFNNNGVFPRSHRCLRMVPCEDK